MLVTVVALFLMSCGNEGTTTNATATANTTSTNPTAKSTSNSAQTTVAKDKVSVTAKNVSAKSGTEVCIDVQDHPNLKDISLMNGSTIYQLCFDAIGKSGTTTEVRFGDKRMISEIVNKRNQFFKLDSKPTVVTIE